MIINYKQAEAWFVALPPQLQYPTHHPHYIENEISQLFERKSLYFLLEDKGDFIYLSGHVPEKSSDIQDVESVRGYGGVVTNVGGPRFTELFERLTSFFKLRGFVIGFLRCTPLLENHEPLISKAFFNRKTVAIPLEKYNGISDFSVRTRTAIRKAIKNKVSSSITSLNSDWKEFYQIYTARMQAIGASDEYCYTLDYFERLASWPHAHLCVAKLDNEIISGAIFITAGNYVEYHLSASTALGMKCASTQLCLAMMSEYWSKKKYHFLHLGGGVTPKLDDSLLFFKAGFSECRYDFFFVKWVIDEARYHDLKENYKSNGKATNKVIFYR